MDIKKYISKKKKVIDTALDKCLPSPKAKPQIIHKAMRYAVFPGGKRIRPILTLASFEACGGKGNSIMSIACAIELIHSYTLIHDDLPCMDNDDNRRGQLSCHKKFNESIALLAGDALLTLSFQLLSETGNADIIKEISRAIGSCGTIGGQVVDIMKTNNERERSEAEPPRRGRTRAERSGASPKGTNDDLDYIASHKTGALIEVAVKTGGIFKGLGKKKLSELSNFGKYIGFTFQLVDDLIDKDGYVEIYSPEHVRKMAELLTKRAKTHLNIFKRRANKLSGIADLVLERRS